jgi:hypothetical protein
MRSFLIERSCWELEQLLVREPEGERPGRPESRIQVRGPLKLRSSRPLVLPSLANMLFLDDVDFRDLEIAGPLDLSRCLFAKRLLLRNTHIHGELRLDDAEILREAQVHGSSEVGLDLAGARVDGGMRAQRLSARDVKLEMSDARMEHHVDLRGVRAGGIVAPGLRVRGNLRLDADVAGDSPLRSELGSITWR